MRAHQLLELRRFDEGRLHPLDHRRAGQVGTDRFANQGTAAIATDDIVGSQSSAFAPFSLNKAAIRLRRLSELPPALADTVPQLPAVKEGKSVAVVCSNFTCMPPIGDPDELAKTLHEVLSR